MSTSDITRRSFIKTTAVTGAALWTAGWSATSAFATGGSVAQPFSSAAHLSVAEIAAMDDAQRLLLYNFETPARVMGALMQGGDSLRIAGFMPAEPADVLALLDQARAARQGDDEISAPAHRTAFAIGWLMHRAVQPYLGTESMPADARLYRDAEVLRAMGTPGGRPEPRHGRSADEVEALYDAMWHRAMIRLHTLKPDLSDVEAWIDRMAAWREAEAQAMRRFAEAVAAPDAGNRRQHVLNANFYNADDPAIVLARLLQHNAAGGPVDVEAALNAPGTSLYAQALAAATRTAAAAARYVEGLDDRTALDAMLAAG